jgi:UDP-N-acetylmuramate--alanine ligase
MLELSPQTIILTNLELDHPDFYRDIEHTQEVFRAYIEKLGIDGTLIVNGDDIHISAILHDLTVPIIRFGMTGASLDLRGTIDKTDEHGQYISLIWKGELIDQIFTALPGTYNTMNILAAVATLLAYGGSTQTVRSVLKKFSGVGRRFEVLGEYHGATVISDYAHHPTALRAVVHATIDRYPGRRVIVIFRPHHQERTKRLYDDFMNVFRDVPHLILLEIYDVAGRESADAISSSTMVEEIKRISPNQDIVFQPSIAAAQAHADKIISTGDVLLVVGAGDAEQLARSLIAHEG